MSLLLHAITPAEPDGGRHPDGIGGRRMVRVVAQDLAAWASEFSDPPERLTRADMLAHHDLVTSLHEDLHAALPARFPTWIGSELEAADLLAVRHAEIAVNLERVRGRVELAVTAVWESDEEDAPPPDAATPGTRYLLRRQYAFAGSDRRRARAGELARTLEKLVSCDLVEIKHQICPSKTIALSSSVLLPRERAENAKALLNHSDKDVRILVSGPWPPYSFADVR